MSGLCIIITTTGTKDLAKQIANELLKYDLSSCAQISEVDSIYKWNDRVYNESEFRLVIKAAKTNEKTIIEKIKAIHAYDLPQIISLDISGGDGEYLKWLTS